METQADTIAAMLRGQIDQCHAAIARVFEYAAGMDNIHYAHELMKTATRLMQASASAAVALKRLQGNESRHVVTVVREGEEPTSGNAKTNSGVSG
jgi:hypothetical protein